MGMQWRIFITISEIICYNALNEGGDFLSIIRVRLNSEEARIYREYAKSKKIPLSTLLKEALEEKIEEEIDLEAIFIYEERLKNREVEYISFEEVKKKIWYCQYGIIMV